MQWEGNSRFSYFPTSNFAADLSWSWSNDDDDEEYNNDNHGGDDDTNRSYEPGMFGEQIMMLLNGNNADGDGDDTDDNEYDDEDDADDDILVYSPGQAGHPSLESPPENWPSFFSQE